MSFGPSSSVGPSLASSGERHRSALHIKKATKGCCREYIDSHVSKERQRYLRKIVNTNMFNAGLILTFVFALFAHDLWNAMEWPDNPTNIFLDLGMVFTALYFLVEFIINCIVDRDYTCCHVLFWMDVLSLVSMVFEISFLAGTAGAMEQPSDAAKLVMARSARAAKLGARAVRFSKVMKMIGMLGYARPKLRRESVSAATEARTEVASEAVSQHIMSNVSRRIALIVIMLVIGVPMVQVESYMEHDVSITVWLHRLGTMYQHEIMNQEQNKDVTESHRFEDLVKDMIAFYNGSAYYPYRIEGFSEKRKVGDTDVRIPGEALLNKPHPPRLEFASEYQYVWDKTWGDIKLECAIYIYVGKIRKLQALENVLLVFVILLIITCMSANLKKQLDYLLDIEKFAQISQKLLRKDMLDAEKFQDLSLESQGVLQEILQHAPSAQRRVFNSCRDNITILSETSAPLPLNENLLNSWEADMLQLDAKDLTIVVMYILFDSRVGRSTGRQCTDKPTFQRFLDDVQAGYNNVSFHNWYHACDVHHACYRMLVDLNCRRWLTKLEQYALLVSAICHDVGHEGRTNAFLVETSHELALRYNDTSPLESMHCSRLFQISRQEGMQIFEHLDKNDFKMVRKVCISAILHTDLSLHFPMVKDIDVVYDMNEEWCQAQAKLPFEFLTEYENEVLKKHHELLLKFILHQSDISGQLKPFSICRSWAERVFEEFFAQGDEEMRLGLPIGLLNERGKTSKPGSQHGFIMFVVYPLAIGAGRIFQPFLPLLRNLNSNLNTWHSMWVESDQPLDEEIAKKMEDIVKVVPGCLFFGEAARRPSARFGGAVEAACLLEPRLLLKPVADDAPEAWPQRS